MPFIPLHSFIDRWFTIYTDHDKRNTVPSSPLCCALASPAEAGVVDRLELGVLIEPVQPELAADAAAAVAAALHVGELSEDALAPRGRVDGARADLVSDAAADGGVGAHHGRGQTEGRRVGLVRRLEGRWVAVQCTVSRSLGSVWSEW